MGIAMGEECCLTVFDGGMETSLVCYPLKRVGRRLIAALSAVAPEGAFVTINAGGSLQFGEVLACWREHRVVNAVIELQEVLAGH